MGQSYITVFQEWLDEKQDQFPGKVSLRKTKHGLSLKISNVAPELYFSIKGSDGGIVVWARYRGIAWDILFDTDLVEKRRGNRLYCALCVSPRKLYASEVKFYREHDFEPFLEWINENIAPRKMLYFFGKMNSWGSCTIGFRKKMSKYPRVHVAALLRKKY